MLSQILARARPVRKTTHSMVCLYPCFQATNKGKPSLVPRPPPFLPFISVHDKVEDRHQPCVIVNANGGGLGTRLGGGLGTRLGGGLGTRLGEAWEQG